MCIKANRVPTHGEVVKLYDARVVDIIVTRIWNYNNDV